MQLPAHLLLENEVGKWPFYMRGQGKYRWVLTRRARENGLSYVGSNERLRAVLDRAMQGGTPCWLSWWCANSDGCHVYKCKPVDAAAEACYDDRVTGIAGKPIKVAAIGGSITAGQGAVDAPNWPQYVLNYLQDELGEKVVSLANGGQPDCIAVGG